MAIDSVGGKVGPFTIVYQDWDGASPERGQWDPAVEAQNADRAILDPDVMAYIGTYNSGAAKISLPKLNRAGLLMVSPAATYPGLSKPGMGEANEPEMYRTSGIVSFFRVVPADDLQGKVAAAWAQKLGAKRVFVVHDREVYGKGIASVFQRSAPEFGLEILGFEGIDPKASNFRSFATKMRQINPDLIFFGGTTQTGAGQFAKDLRSVGLKTKFMGPDGCFEKAFIDSAGAANLNGMTYVTFGGVPPEQLSGKGRAFFEEYQRQYGTPPAGYSAYAYEATKVILDAIARAGKKDRTAIIEAVAATSNYDGILGTWSFDKNGDTTLSTMSGNIVEGGEFKFSTLLP
jgi:branched-chain amino acid transport system substrate-binding protein